MKYTKRNPKQFLQYLFIPLALAGLSILAYAPILHSLGFYWDDWPMIWFGNLLGTKGYIEVLSSDRPFLAGAYLFSTTLLGNSPLQWQIFSLITRWLVSLSVWWTLTKLWPNQKQAGFWIAALFAVYPGFHQQPISVIYGNGYLLLIAFFLSFGFTFMAMRSSRRYWLYTAIAMLLDLFCSFSTEYYFGLNLVRYIIIFFLVRVRHTNKSDILKHTLFFSLPYLVNTLVFLVWRVFVFGFSTYQPQGITAISSGNKLLIENLLFRVFTDPFLTGIVPWLETFRFPQFSDFSTPSRLAFWLLVLAGTVYLVFIFWSYNRVFSIVEEQPAGEPDFGHTGGWIALASLVLPGIPYWATNLPINLTFPWDRFTLPFMFGSALGIVWLLYRILRTTTQIKVCLIMLISMAIGSHFSNALTFQREWNSQTKMLWQLSLRAPSIKPNTTVITHGYGLHLKYYSDNSLTAPLNWIYAPNNHALNLPYFFAFSDVRVGNSIPSLEPNQAIHQGYRNASFYGNTSQMLSISYSPPGCLHVLDPARSSVIAPMRIENQELIGVSNPDVILDTDQGAILPREIFPHDPPIDWCYYFEKADLARQFKKWDKITQLMDEASQQGFTPKVAEETFPFIEGFAHQGKWDRVYEISEYAIQLDKSIQPQLCALTHQLIADNTLPNGAQALTDLFNNNNCSFYYPSAR